MRYTHYPSPLGPLLLAADAGGLRLISFPTGKQRRQPEPDWQLDDSFGPLPATVAQLDAYFAGTLTCFDLPLAPGGTPFQQQVWQALQTIPFGITWSYGQLARVIGRPKASRAVGAANGANPLPIIIPCHRVIGASGSLTGFGGGLTTKHWLLEFEGALSDAGGAQLPLFPATAYAEP